MAAGATTSLLASLLVAAGPAHAYNPNPAVSFASVDTDNCARRSGTLTVVRQANGCFLDDTLDNTLFEFDANAVAGKIELHVGGSMAGKVEFHPLDEKIWIYDTRDDNDAIYVTVCRIIDLENPLCQADEGPWTPDGGPGTDLAVIDRNYPDGQAIRISVWDNSDATDLIARVSGVT